MRAAWASAGALISRLAAMADASAMRSSRWVRRTSKPPYPERQLEWCEYEIDREDGGSKRCLRDDPARGERGEEDNDGEGQHLVELYAG